MSVRIECDSCGHRYRIGERVFDEDAKQMVCPKCGHDSFTTDRSDISWHPTSDE